MRFYTIIICTALAAISAPAAAVVAPTGTAGVEGNNQFGGIIYDLQQTSQMLIPVSLLTGLSAGNQITGLQFRLDASQSSGPGIDFVFSNFDVTFSQTTIPNSLLFNSAFADQIGPDAVLVRSGPLTIPANSFPAGGAPNNFGFLISFTTPYVYKGGDLLVMLRIFSSNFTASNLILDAQSVSSGGTLSGAPYNGTNSSGASGYVPVMQFQIGQVAIDDPVATTPEPATWSLVVLGCALMLRKRA